MKKGTIISSLILLGCVVSMHAQVVKGTKGSNGDSGGGVGSTGLFIGAGGASAVGSNLIITNKNVGINTNNPSQTLHVVGNILATSFMGGNFSGSSFTAPSGSVLGYTGEFTTLKVVGNMQAGVINSSGLIQGNALSTTGNVNAASGVFTNSQPNGSVFADWKDKNRKCTVLNVGAVRDPLDDGRLLVFRDYPQSNMDPKAVSYFSIDDRGNFTRFAFRGEQGGSTSLMVNNKSQEVLMRVFEDGNDAVFMDLPKTNSRIVIGAYGDYLPGYKFVVTGSAKIEGNILTDSNIGIGTANFADGSDTYRLSVKGKIRAEEVRVYTTWADYVFMKDYKLPNLREVETYIKENGHLKNVPSAEEVTEKGLQLGDMAKIQQEKIEELTLYLIQQNKEIEELKVQVKALLNKK